MLDTNIILWADAVLIDEADSASAACVGAIQGILAEADEIDAPEDYAPGGDGFPWGANFDGPDDDGGTIVGRIVA